MQSAQSSARVLVIGLACSVLTSCAAADETAAARVCIPAPGAVQLDREGRLGVRFHRNTKYLRYLYEKNGDEMLTAYDERHYAPNKFLELVWDREYAGKWLDAASRTAASTGDKEQSKLADTFAAGLRRRQQPDGYMGIPLPVDRELDGWEQEWDNWNQWNALNGLLSHYEYRGNRDSLDAASRVGAWVVKTYGPIQNKNARFFQGEAASGLTNVAIIGQLVRLYRHNGDKKLIEFVAQVVEHFPAIRRMRASGNPEMAHGYMLNAILGGVAEFSDVTGDEENLAWVEKVWERMAEDHRYPTGSLSSGEALRDEELEDDPDGHLQETCATTEWIFFTQSLYVITGRVRYVEALEQTFFNALLGAQSVDGMKWCYFLPLRYHKDWFHGPTNCCYWSGPKGLSRLPDLIYGVRDDVIYVNFYESSRANLATRGENVRVVQESACPKTGLSRVRLDVPSRWTGVLRLRLPSWSADFAVTLNGGPVRGTSVQNGYRDFELAGSTTYEVEVRFDVPVVREAFAGGYFMRRGPELLAIDVRDNDQMVLDWVAFPEQMKLRPAEPDGERRRYSAELAYQSSGEPRTLRFTPFADAGNDGAAFRTVFPKSDD